MSIVRLRAHSLLRGAVAAAALAIAAGPGGAQPAAVAAPPTLDQLQAAYLECDRRSARDVLDFASAVQCSIVSEQLLQRGFGGDLDRLLAWWRRERTSQVPVTTPLF